MMTEPSPGILIVWAAGTVWYHAPSTSRGLNIIAGIPRYKSATSVGSSGLPREGSPPALRPVRQRHYSSGQKGISLKSREDGCIGNQKDTSTTFMQRRK